ncbi:MAG TPA: hypothetical protein VNM22_19360 [Candidatus Limnocylindrales bacterium]|nr:hypothetical protein [Candidatus Limnocylindrales bacterium]
MQFLRVPMKISLRIFAILGSLSGLYVLYQLLQVGRDVCTGGGPSAPTADIRLLWMVSVFGLTGSLLLIFGTFVLLLGEWVLQILERFRHLQAKKVGYKLTVDTERITHLELVVTSALERLERRLQVLEEKSGEESIALEVRSLEETGKFD